jgi:hypothetical protein
MRNQSLKRMSDKDGYEGIVDSEFKKEFVARIVKNL